MGLRTASVRHPHAEVMAPALTESVQTQNFDLPPKSCLEPVFPAVNSYRKNKFIVRDQQAYLKVSDAYENKVHLDSDAITSNIVLGSEKILDNCHKELDCASDTNSDINIMNISPSSMDDEENKMGLQKTALDISLIHKDKKSSDMEQLLHNLTVSPDLETNVEDIMQVIKSIEGGERLNNTSNDLNAESDDIFPMAGTDLTNNLSSFEKELLENVDVMNMTIEDQQDELDTADKQKESQAKEVLNLLQIKHTKLERRLDFLKRRVYKLQSRYLGQHVSSEIAGVFENVHQSLKKPKEPHEEPVSIFSKAISPIDKLKPLSYNSAKTLVRKLEMTTVLQASTVARQKNTPKYFGSGSVEIPVPRTNSSGVVTILPWPLDAKNELQKVAAHLKTHTSLTQIEVDSEATESSSGGESCDEMQNYNNPHQQYLSVQKRALWKYSTDRAMIAARWTWLQAQIADLEYRIRQHTDLHKQVRTNKGNVQLGGESPPRVTSTSQTVVNGYRGQLPGSSLLSSKADDSVTNDTFAADYQCARTRPLIKFKKRKLFQIAGLHALARKAARPSNMRCGCVPLSNPCALCTGRTDPTYPRDPPDTLSREEKVTLLDPGFHTVFSLPEDTSQSIHFEAVIKTQEWQQRTTRMKTFKVSKPERHEPKSLEHRTKKLEHRKKYGRLLKSSTISALSAKIRSKIRGRKPGRPPNSVHRKRHLTTDLSSQSSGLPTDSALDEEVESIGNNSNHGGQSADSPSSSPLLHMHSISSYNKRSSSSRFQSYDIDNIVIPYSVAAATRVEKLQYKEILTPKWRVVDPDCGNPFETKNNGAVKEADPDSDVEDLTDEAVVARHDRSEYDEKKRFLSYLKLPLGYGRSRSNRRTDSRAESSGGNTPDPMSPHNPDHHDSPMTSPPATPMSTGCADDSQQLPQLPSIAVMRRRTMSQSRFGMGGKEREIKDESRATTPDIVEVPPYEKRTFPINEETYEKMLKHMPEDHQFPTYIRSQDSTDNENKDDSYLDQKLDSPDTESTESAIGDGEEDPNDPEWIDVERLNRERHKR